jgi:hypothetical protein
MGNLVRVFKAKEKPKCRERPMSKLMLTLVAVIGVGSVKAGNTSHPNHISSAGGNYHPAYHNNYQGGAADHGGAHGGGWHSQAYRGGRYWNGGYWHGHYYDPGYYPDDSPWFAGGLPFLPFPFIPVPVPSM